MFPAQVQSHNYNAKNWLNYAHVFSNYNLHVNN